MTRSNDGNIIKSARSSLSRTLRRVVPRSRKRLSVVGASKRAIENTLNAEPDSEIEAARVALGVGFSAARPSEALNVVYAEQDHVNMYTGLLQAKHCIRAGYFDEAIDLLLDVEGAGPPHKDVQRLLGEMYFRREKWEKSRIHWYRAAALIGQDANSQRQKIRVKIMRCNARLAVMALDEGDKIRAAEYLAQAIEAVDFETYLKPRTDMVEAITRYAFDELKEKFGAPHARSERPRRIAICIDVVKISPVHSHKHLYLSLAAALAALDPEMTVDIIATHERQITWNAGFEEYYRFDNQAQLVGFINEMIPEGIRERINVHYFETFGLRGLIDTCKEIHGMSHDVIIYGGGQRGYHGNESLLVRHLLYQHTPTAFFFVQSNNVVDQKNDMIIARGQHPIIGDSGDVRIEYKPYPTFPGLQAAVVPTGFQNKKIDQSKPRILTAWAGVRLDITINGYTDEQINNILDILDAIPGSEWHLVGAVEPAKLLNKHSRALSYRREGRIIAHSTLTYDQFYELVSSASLFFQTPDITGGGGGASIARNNMVPIVCFRNSDVAPLQPIEYVFEPEDLNQAIKTAIRILGSAEEKAKLVGLQNDLLQARRTSAPADFMDCLKETVRLYNARISHDQS